MTVRTRRRGFSMAETVVAVVIAGAVGAIVATLVLRQGAAGSQALRHAAAHAQRAQANAALAAELAPLAHGAGRVALAHDSVVEFEASVGVALICRAAVAGARSLAVAAAGSASPIAADGWARAAAAGDSVLVFDAASGAWDGATLASASTGSCASGALAGTARLLSLAAPGLRADAPLGTPVQVRRRVRWSSYRASDGRWYLGIRERTGGRWATVQPVAGPLDAGAGPPRPFALLDAAGAAVSATTGISGASLLEVRLSLEDERSADRQTLVAPLRVRP
ncbi:MAG: hypothetical protein HY275_00665 [Gemmatimonadetes bacterium]|nr:hypothetical protein [Gemmatimonadota bacterium]